MSHELIFTLTNRDFHEHDPAIRFSRMNALAFVARIQQAQPERFRITFDGTPATTMWLMELAGEIDGYSAVIESTSAVFERV